MLMPITVAQLYKTEFVLENVTACDVVIMNEAGFNVKIEFEEDFPHGFHQQGSKYFEPTSEVGQYIVIRKGLDFFMLVTDQLVQDGMRLVSNHGGLGSFVANIEAAICRTYDLGLITKPMAEVLLNEWTMTSYNYDLHDESFTGLDALLNNFNHPAKYGTFKGAN